MSVLRQIVVGFCALFAASLAAADDGRSLNQIPMYGDGPKSAAMKAADQELVKAVLAQGLTREQAAKKSVQIGWKTFFRGDPNTAIMRFNQAWLFNPEDGNAFHGFAVVSASVNRPADEVERYFRTAISKPNVTPGAHIDYARFLNLQERHREAIDLAMAALRKTPDAKGARTQLFYAYMAMGDAINSCKWGRAAKKAGERPGLQTELMMACRHSLY